MTKSRNNYKNVGLEITRATYGVNSMTAFDHEIREDARREKFNIARDLRRQQEQERITRQLAYANMQSRKVNV